MDVHDTEILTAALGRKVMDVQVRHREGRVVRAQQAESIYG